MFNKKKIRKIQSEIKNHRHLINTDNSRNNSFRNEIDNKLEHEKNLNKLLLEKNNQKTDLTFENHKENIEKIYFKLSNITIIFGIIITIVLIFLAYEFYLKDLKIVSLR